MSEQTGESEHYPKHLGIEHADEDGSVWLCDFDCPACDHGQWDWPMGMSRSDLTCGGTADVS